MTGKIYQFPQDREARLRHNRIVSGLLHVLEEIDPDMAAEVRAREKKRLEASFMPKNIESYKVPNSPEEAVEFVNKHLDEVERRRQLEVKETYKRKSWPRENAWQLVGFVLAALFFFGNLGWLVVAARSGMKL